MNSSSEFGPQEIGSYTGIPALEIRTYKPGPILRKPGIKTGSQRLLLTSRVLTDYGWTSGSVTHNMDASTPEFVFYSRVTQPTRSVFLYDSYPAKYIPAETVYVSTTSSSTSLLGQFDQLFENTKAFLQTLANDYAIGILDIPEIVRQLGEPWTESTVVLLLEFLGAHRPISMAKLSQQEKEDILNKLSQVRAASQAEEFNNTSWVQREVIASQRIESIYILPEHSTNKQP